MNAREEFAFACKLVAFAAIVCIVVAWLVCCVDGSWYAYDTGYLDSAWYQVHQQNAEWKD